MPKSEILIFIPTYNEMDNVEAMCAQIQNLALDADLLFIDDHSSDGTGGCLDSLAGKYSNVTVHHRPGKLGIGSAHQEGITYAYQQGYSILVTMDCDFTHMPADIPRLLEASRNQDVTLGSRYINPHSLPGWNLYRRSITHLGHFLTRHLLDLPYDASGAFRLYRLSRIPHAVFKLVSSTSYAFFFESLFVLKENGSAIKEIPIVLPARTYGNSKMSYRDATRSLRILMEVWLRRSASPEQYRLGKVSLIIQNDLVDPQQWDAYWNRKSHLSGLIYEFIAAFYRKNVIRRNFNRWAAAHFAPGSRLLHAGSGSGQVDADLQKWARITALDISVGALELYCRNNPLVKEISHGSIQNIPLPEESFDGVYNLGVLEHFSLGDIHRILGEFHRVLRPGGKILIFWPYRWATSVMVLGAVHFFLRRFLGNNEALHPPEISLLASREQARLILEKAQFRLVDYSFGIRDLFVQAVIVGQKT